LSSIGELDDSSSRPSWTLEQSDTGSVLPTWCFSCRQPHVSQVDTVNHSIIKAFDREWVPVSSSIASMMAIAMVTDDSCARM